MSEIIECSLVLPIQGNRICLAMKKEGEELGTGKLNGPGGHLELGETAEQSAIRECQEEIRIVPKVLNKVVELHYIRPHSEKIGHIVVHTFTCPEWEGEPTETEIMIPQWFDTDKIPYDQMWESDQYWLPRTLGGEVLRCTFHYDENDKLTYQQIKRVDNL